MDEQSAIDDGMGEEVIPEYEHRMSTWPVFWGVISIIFGVGGVLMAGYGALQAAAMTMMPMDEILAEQQAAAGTTNVPGMEGMMVTMVEMAPFSLAAGIAQAIVAIVLIVGGSALCARKRMAAPILQTWAGLKIVIGMIGAWIGYKSSVAMMASMSEVMKPVSGASGGASASGIPDMAGIMNIGMMVGLIIGLIWMLLLPVFFLCWFNRPAVKEDMKHGQGW